MLYWRKLLVGLHIAASAAIAQSALALDVTERALRAAVLEENDRALALLEEVVNINSGTMNLDGVSAVGEVFIREFEAAGFHTNWVPGDAFGRAGHLVASRGDHGPKILMIGHLDTVFEKDSPFQRFERVDEHHAAGPGITDMKGGCVIILQTARALAAAGVDDVQLRVVLAGDEEARGRPLKVANEALVDAAKWADYALGFEDGDGDPTTAVTMRRSSSRWTLRVTGRPAHSSQIFQEEVGYGAALEVARILHRWQERLSKIPNLTFNPGLVMAGTDIDHDEDNTRGSVFGKGNVVAQTAIATGGMRALSPIQIVEAEALMQAIVFTSLPQTSAELEFEHGYPPMAPATGNDALLAAYTAVSEDLGYGPVVAVDPRRAGAADISFIADLVDGAMDGLGLMGTGGHTVDEVADLRTLPQQVERAAVLLYRLASGKLDLY